MLTVNVCVFVLRVGTSLTRYFNVHGIEFFFLRVVHMFAFLRVTYHYFSWRTALVHNENCIGVVIIVLSVAFVSSSVVCLNVLGLKDVVKTLIVATTMKTALENCCWQVGERVGIGVDQTLWRHRRLLEPTVASVASMLFWLGLGHRFI